MATPSVNGPNGHSGRDKAGKFAKGNAGGPGNPLGNRMTVFRQACLDATTPAEVKQVIKHLYRLAMEDDDVAAAKVYLERVLGPVNDSIHVQAHVDHGQVVVVQIPAKEE